MDPLLTAGDPCLHQAVWYQISLLKAIFWQQVFAKNVFILHQNAGPSLQVQHPLSGRHEVTHCHNKEQ